MALVSSLKARYLRYHTVSPQGRHFWIQTGEQCRESILGWKEVVNDRYGEWHSLCE
jgi:hypothetical protein